MSMAKVSYGNQNSLVKADRETGRFFYIQTYLLTHFFFYILFHLTSAYKVHSYYV